METSVSIYLSGCAVVRSEVFVKLRQRGFDGKPSSAVPGEGTRYDNPCRAGTLSLPSRGDAHGRGKDGQREGSDSVIPPVHK